MHPMHRFAAAAAFWESRENNSIHSTGVCTYYTDINMRRWRMCPETLRSENMWGLSAKKWTEMHCQAKNDKSTSGFSYT